MKRKKVKNFTPHWGYKATFLTLGIVSAIAHAILFRTVPDIPLFALISLIGVDAVLLWWGIIFSTQSRVTIYDEGIELERGASKLFATWDNLSHLGIKHGGKNQRRGIWLHEPIQAETTGLIERLFFGWKTDFLSLGQFVNLPRQSVFSREIDKDKLLETEFGTALYEFAPRLFDEEKAKNRLKDGYNNEELAIDSNEESYHEAQEN